MDSLIFIASLGVAAAVICWYVANEVSRGDGGRGLFALHDGTAKSEDAASPVTQGRYRQKARLAPARRASATPLPFGKAYRPAAPTAPVRREYSEIAFDDDY